MSTVNESAPVPAAVVNQDEAVNNSVAASQATDETIKKLQTDLRALYSSRRTFQYCLKLYERTKKRFSSLLAKEDAPAEGEKAVEAKKARVIAVYRLIRNFCLSYNILRTERDDDRQFVPEAWRPQIMVALGENQTLFDQISKALKAANIQDSNACLPAEISESIPKAVIDLIEAHDQSEIVSKLQASIADVNDKISPLQKELKSKGKQIKKKQPKKAKQKKAASKAKESPASVNPSEEKSTEVRFRDIIKEVRQRVSQAKLVKDDWAIYCQIQHELDTFLKEATSDITAIKIGLKTRFEKLQQPKVKKAEARSNSKSKADRRSNSRRAAKNVKPVAEGV